MLTDVPLVAVSGDASITLQNGEYPGSKRPVKGLISYQTRRLSRKKVGVIACAQKLPA